MTHQAGLRSRQPIQVIEGAPLGAPCPSRQVKLVLVLRDLAKVHQQDGSCPQWWRPFPPIRDFARGFSIAGWSRKTARNFYSRKSKCPFDTLHVVTAVYHLRVIEACTVYDNMQQGRTCPLQNEGVPLLLILFLQDLTVACDQPTTSTTLPSIVPNCTRASIIREGV